MTSSSMWWKTNEKLLLKLGYVLMGALLLYELVWRCFALAGIGNTLAVAMTIGGLVCAAGVPFGLRKSRLLPLPILALSAGLFCAASAIGLQVRPSGAMFSLLILAALNIWPAPPRPMSTREKVLFWYELALTLVALAAMLVYFGFFSAPVQYAHPLTR
jgi:hypothetical protein